MFIKIVPWKEDHNRAHLYEGENIRCDVFEVTKDHDGIGKMRQTIRESIECSFFSENREKFDWYHTILIQFKDKTGVWRIIEAPLSEVFIMNNEGKTIDKFGSGFMQKEDEEQLVA